MASVWEVGEDLGVMARAICGNGSFAVDDTVDMVTALEEWEYDANFLPWSVVTIRVGEPRIEWSSYDTSADNQVI